MPQLRALVSQTLLEDYPSVLTRVETRYADIVTTANKMRIGYGVPDVAQLAWQILYEGEGALGLHFFNEHRTL